VNEENSRIAFKVSSEMNLVDRVIRETGEFIGKFEAGKPENLKIVLRELLINAIEHGNGSDMQLSVECTVEHLDDNRFKIVVKDSGDGFDYGSLNLLVPEDPNQDRNRGLPLVNALADEIAFNEKGNEVTAYLSLVRETKFSVNKFGDTQVISPSGNLTASSADKLRIILIELLDAGEKDFMFDFSDVEDLDSISLSLLITFSKMHKNKLEGQGELRIVEVSEDLKNLFELTRVNRIYKVTTAEGK
jgi:anti-anti-sigma factor